LVGLCRCFEFGRDGEVLRVCGEQKDVLPQLGYGKEKFRPRAFFFHDGFLCYFYLLLVEQEQAGDNEAVGVAVCVAVVCFGVGFGKHDEQVGFEFVAAAETVFEVSFIAFVFKSRRAFYVDFRAVEDEVVGGVVELYGQVGVDGFG
jgi:hypothetical protein